MKGNIILTSYLDFGCEEIELVMYIKKGFLCPYLSEETLCLTKKKWEYKPGYWDSPSFYKKRIVWKKIKSGDAEERDGVFQDIKKAINECIDEAKDGIKKYNALARLLKRRELKLIVKSLPKL